jgi:phthiodiolone/phenolphthiodiolone dimycocerosates ketoreductase
MSIKPAIWFMTLAARNHDDLEEALDSEVIRAGALNAPDHFFARHGAQHPLGIGFTGAQDILPQDMDEHTALSYVKAIPTEVVRDCLLCGTPDEIADRAAHWRDCGVEYVVLANLGPLQRSLRKGMASMLPFVQAVRRLRKL